MYIVCGVSALEVVMTQAVNHHLKELLPMGRDLKVELMVVDLSQVALKPMVTSGRLPKHYLILIGRNSWMR